MILNKIINFALHSHIPEIQKKRKNCEKGRVISHIIAPAMVKIELTDLKKKKINPVMIRSRVK